MDCIFVRPAQVLVLPVMELHVHNVILVISLMVPHFVYLVRFQTVSIVLQKQSAHNVSKVCFYNLIHYAHFVLINV